MGTKEGEDGTGAGGGRGAIEDEEEEEKEGEGEVARSWICFCRWRGTGGGVWKEEGARLSARAGTETLLPPPSLAVAVAEEVEGVRSRLLVEGGEERGESGGGER